MSAREEMVCAGLPIAGRIFTRYSKDIIWEADVIDGEKVAGNTTLARISGPAIDLLTAERTAINILQYLSGIATLTLEYVE
jgi:nicotinate-nucleotide pyrophosphorylase (carboxylating)